MKIILNKGQKLWFTSDTHYNHANICRATTQWDITLRDKIATIQYLAHWIENLL